MEQQGNMDSRRRYVHSTIGNGYLKAWHQVSRCIQTVKVTNLRQATIEGDLGCNGTIIVESCMYYNSRQSWQKAADAQLSSLQDMPKDLPGGNNALASQPLVLPVWLLTL